MPLCCVARTSRTPRAVLALLPLVASASTSHAPVHHHHSPATPHRRSPCAALDLPVAASSGLAHGRPCHPLGGLAHGPANHGHKYAPGTENNQPTTQVRPPGRKRCAACPNGHKAGHANRWGTVALGVRPGSRVAALFLSCERGSHRQTASSQGPASALRLNY